VALSVTGPVVAVVGFARKRVRLSAVGVRCCGRPEGRPPPDRDSRRWRGAGEVGGRRAV